MNKYSILVVLFLAGLMLSGINPHDYFTWALEVFPAVLGFMVLLFTFKKFRFSYPTYVFVLIHCYILFIGGHYTYAEVPLFDKISEWLSQGRNNYDKVGHFAQGFIPALIARELFIRKDIVKGKGWISFLTASVSLSISGIYELLEWLVALLTGESAEAFLGTQGYVWDTQSDIFYALTGSLCMLLFFSRYQDRCIARIGKS